MFTRNLPIFLKVQIFLLLAVGIVLLIGDRSQPKIGKLPEAVMVNQPIIVTFERPMKKESVEKGFKLALGESEVKGAFSWSSRSVAFTPDEPLAYNASYQLSLTGIEDIEGHVLRNSYTKTVRTSSARFVYITPEFKLALYNVSTKQASTLSDDSEKILSYAVSVDGKWLLASFQDTKDQNLSGVYSLRLEEGGGTDKTMLYRGADAVYTKVEICGPDSLALAAKNTIDGDGRTEESGIVSFPLGENGFDFGEQSVFLPSEEISSTSTLVCSTASDQVMYRSLTGNLVLGSLSEPRGGALGSYMFAYGFSPKGTTVLLGDTTSATLPTNRVAYAINDKGLRELVSGSSADSAYPAYDPSEQILAIAENVRGVGDEDDYQNHFKISLRQRDRGIVTIRSVTEGSADASDEHPTWSSDGRYLSFERIPRDAEYGHDRPQDNEGNLIDGEIWLSQLKPGTNFLTREIVAEDLNLKGSGILWLP